MPETVSTYDRLLVSVTLEKREGPCALFVQKNSRQTSLVRQTLKMLIRQKHLAWKEYKRSHSLECLTSFRSIRNKVTTSLHLAEKRYFLPLHRCSKVTKLYSSSQSKRQRSCKNPQGINSQNSVNTRWQNTTQRYHTQDSTTLALYATSPFLLKIETKSRLWNFYVLAYSS